MELTRMAKITVLADGSRWHDMVKKLTEVGVRYYHLLECAAIEAGPRATAEGAPKRILLEALADMSHAPAIARAIGSSGDGAIAGSVAVSEVSVSRDYRESEATSKAPARQEWWEKGLISI